MKTLLPALALVLAGCSAAGPTPQAATTSSAGAGVQEPPAAPAATSSASEPDSSEPDLAGDRQRPEGRTAPEFVLPLGQGGEFSLAAEAKPVYMVFWAEW